METLFDDVSLSFVNGFRDARIILEEALADDKNFDNETERTLFELVAFHNFTYEQAAKHLDMSLRRVGYRYRNILQRLMQYLKAKGIDDLEDLL